MRIKRILIAVLFGAASLVQATTNDLTALLQKGLFEEEANHNLEAAVQAYQTAIGEHDKDRKLVATAVFRLGECFRKQGKTNEASLQYERVIHEFADQEMLVKLSTEIVGAPAKPVSGVAQASAEPPEVRALEIAYQEVAPKAIAARALAQRVEKLTNLDDRIRFFTTIRPDETLVGYVPIRAVRESKFKLAAMSYGKDHPDYKVAELEFNESLREIGNRIDTLVWAIKNDAESLTKQAKDLQDQLRVAQRSAVPSVLVQTATKQPEPLASTTEEEEEIRKIQALIKNSPDLINATISGSTPLRTPLELAAENGQLRVAECLLANGADVDGGNRKPLYFAASKGHKAMVELLLSKGANPNEGIAFNEAARNGFKSVVEVFLAHKADVNQADNNGNRPLHLAASNGKKAIAELLIASGAEIDARANNGETALICAAQSGQKEIAQLLINHKASVNATNRFGVTPLHGAVENSNLEMAKLLLANGADVEALRIVDSIGQTPLARAVNANKPEMVELLLQNHADPNHNSVGSEFTPLLTAIRDDRQPAIVESLLAHGANPDMEADDWSPLFLALIHSRNDALQSLINHKVNIQIVRKMETPLMAAVGHKNYRAVELLCDAGADVNATTDFRDWLQNTGNTALYLAVLNGDLKMVKLLIGCKADVDKANSTGIPPIGWINSGRGTGGSGQDRDEIKDLLIKAGADVNFERAREIAVNTDKVRAVFYKGTNVSNSHTLGELIAETYTFEMGTFWELNPRKYPYGQIPFPDFANITISRRQTDGSVNVIHADATSLVQSGDGKDVLLEWGDIVSIPEQDHKVGEPWDQLSNDQIAMLTKSLSRRVDVVTKAQRSTVLLAPNLASRTTRTRGIPGDDGILVALRQTNTVVVGLKISEFLDQKNKMRRVSWDVSRIKVTRRAADGTQKEIIMDESSNPGINDLFLRDGDVIEIPDRDPNGPAADALSTPPPPQAPQIVPASRAIPRPLRPVPQ